MITIENFRLKFAYTSKIERMQFCDFIEDCIEGLSDTGTDCFISRELRKFATKQRKKADTSNSLKVSLTWYELQAIIFVFGCFVVPDYQILAKVAFGKIDQALPAGFGAIKS